MTSAVSIFGEAVFHRNNSTRSEREEEEENEGGAEESCARSRRKHSEETTKKKKKLAAEAGVGVALLCEDCLLQLEHNSPFPPLNFLIQTGSHCLRLEPGSQIEREWKPQFRD